MSRFCVVGISHQSAPEQIRSEFSLVGEQQDKLLCEATRSGLRSVMILCTCNRSEIYGYCGDDNVMTELFLRHVSGNKNLFAEYGFVKRGEEALRYLFEVATGLQSQITGDYEIAGQIRQAMSKSKSHDLLGPVMQRTVDTVLQASKAVRSSTRISTGTVSVSYAAIEWLNKLNPASNPGILIIGAGAMGTGVARNIRTYLPAASLCIVNRTVEKAIKLSKELDASFAHLDTLKERILAADIVIICTNAASPVLKMNMMNETVQQIVMDLSVPANADAGIRDLHNVRYVGIDEVSKTLQDTLEQRSSDVEKAKTILGRYVQEFMDWLSHFRHSLLIQDVRNKLYLLTDTTTVMQEVADGRSRDQYVNRTIGTLAMSLRYKKEKGCEFINAINEFLGVETGGR